MSNLVKFWMVHEYRWFQEQVEAADVCVEVKMHECSLAADLATGAVEGGCLEASRFVM